ncbi:MAG: glutamate--tRNA ligase family protein [Saprospiraceae bacterium]
MRIYPMYDMAHGQSEGIEKITHSICTLEFVPHRELHETDIDRPSGIHLSKQYEFARRKLSYTVVSGGSCLVGPGEAGQRLDDPGCRLISEGAGVVMIAEAIYWAKTSRHCQA